MKRLVFLFSLCILLACKGGSAYPKAENALDAGREFLDGFLKGNTEKAKAYMLDDPKNQQLLMQAHNKFKRLGEEAKSELKTVSIEIGGIDEVSENETIIQYKDSYDRIGRKIKVVQQNNTWLVDFKYTLNPNM